MPLPRSASLELSASVVASRVPAPNVRSAVGPVPGGSVLGTTGGGVSLIVPENTSKVPLHPRGRCSRCGNLRVVVAYVCVLR